MGKGGRKGEGREGERQKSLLKERQEVEYMRDVTTTVRGQNLSRRGRRWTSLDAGRGRRAGERGKERSPIL